MQLGLVASPSSPLRCHLAKLVTCAILQMGKLVSEKLGILRIISQTWLLSSHPPPSSVHLGF